jgi:hypothetical protein
VVKFEKKLQKITFSPCSSSRETKKLLNPWNRKITQTLFNFKSVNQTERNTIIIFSQEMRKK